MIVPHTFPLVLGPLPAALPAGSQDRADPSSGCDLPCCTDIRSKDASKRFLGWWEQGALLQGETLLIIVCLPSSGER